MPLDPRGAHHGWVRSRRHLLRWWVVPGVVTIALAVFNSPWVRLRMPGSMWRRGIATFGLSFEMNFAVWWSAVLFLLGAALFYEIAANESRPRRRGRAPASPVPSPDRMTRRSGDDSATEHPNTCQETRWKI